MARKKKSDYVIKSVSNALDLLEELTKEDREIGVTELSKRLRLHKNNIFRLLATLETRGYVEQNELTDDYRIGLNVLKLGRSFINQGGFVRQARPFLEALSRECGETAYSGIMRDRGIIYLDAAESDRSMRVVARLGAQIPLYCTAIGKAQLAHAPFESLDEFLPRELEKFTQNTITDRNKLIEHLKEIADQGYAIDNEEHEIGIKCVGAPVLDYSGRVIGGISVSGPASRMGEKRIAEEIAPRVRRASEEISIQLGRHRLS